MSGTVFDRDRRIRAASLTMGQTFYLCTLNQFVGNNHDAWPSQTTLANAMNAGVRSVRKWQTELEAMGVILVAVGQGRAQTNRYELDLDQLPIPESLNEAPHAAFTGLNEAPHAGDMRHHMPVNAAPHAYRKNKKEHGKEQGVFPEELSDSDEFKEAWGEWTEHRREIRKKLTPSTTKKQLAMLAELGPDAAVESIGQSIRNGWTGLFAPNGEVDCTNGTASDFAQVHNAVLSVYTPDLRNHADVERSLTPEQAQAAKQVGIDRIYRSKVDDRSVVAAYCEARRAGA